MPVHGPGDRARAGRTVEATWPRSNRSRVGVSREEKPAAVGRSAGLPLASLRFFSNRAGSEDGCRHYRIADREHQKVC